MKIFHPSEPNPRPRRRAGVVVKAAADVVARAIGLAAEDNVGRSLEDGIELLISLREIAVELLQSERLLLEFLGALGYALFEFEIQTLKLPLLAVQLREDLDFRTEHLGNDRH